MTFSTHQYSVAGQTVSLSGHAQSGHVTALYTEAL